MSKLLIILACVPITPIALGIVALWKLAARHMRRNAVVAGD